MKTQATQVYLFILNMIVIIGLPISLLGQIIVTESIQLPTCNSTCNGSIELTVTNGNPPYVYSWSNGETTSSLTNVCPGSYHITISDASYNPPIFTWSFTNTGINANCAFYQSSILVNNQPITNGDVLGVFYENGGVLECGGYWTINGTGLTAITIWGDDVYTLVKDGFTAGDTIFYALWNHLTGETIELIPTGYNAISPNAWTYEHNGMYELIGLLGTSSFTFNSPVDLNFALIPLNEIQINSYISAFAQFQVSANGGSDGYIQTSAWGGTPPYEYLWSTGETNTNISNLSAGVYTLTVTDSQGCQDISIYPLSQPALIQVNSTVSNYNGFNTSLGNSDGFIHLYISGGIAPYSVQWSNGLSGNHVYNLAAGSYQVTITDQGSGFSIMTFNLTETLPQPLVFFSSSTSSYPNGYNISQFGGADGSITVTLTDGYPPYQYLWSNGGSTQNISNLPAGLYSVTCSDSLETSYIRHFKLTEPPYYPMYDFSYQLSQFGELNISTFGGNDGAISLSVLGGNQPINYTWSTGLNSQFLQNLTAGTYTVTISDGITSLTETFTLIDTIQFPSILTTYSVENNPCFNSCNGEINLSLSGGTPPYYSIWNDGVTDLNRTNLCAGTYSVSLIDSLYSVAGFPWNYYNSIFWQEIIYIPANSVLINGNSPIIGDRIGVFKLLNGSYICSGYTTWTGGDIQIMANIYENNLNVNGFENYDTIYWKLWKISDGSEIWLDPVYQNNYNGLFLMNSISAIATLTGTYNPSTSTPSINVQYLSIDITEPDPLQSFAGITHEDTLLTIPGSIFTYTSGGTPPYEFNWSNGDTTASINQLSAGTYTLTITDANLCDTSYSWTVSTVPVPPLTMSNASTNISCFGACDGTISISIISGTPPYLFSWSEGSTTQNLSGLCPGTYELTVSDLAYSQTHSFVLTEPTAIQMDTILGLVDPLIGNNGSIDLNISGGTLPYTFEWSTGGLGEDVVGIGVGTYTVTFTDGNNCQEIYQFTMTNAYNLPPVNIQSSLVQPLCYNDCAGSIQLSVSGGLPPYSYVWSGGETAESLTNLCAGLYEVTVSTPDTSISLQFELINPPALDVILTSVDIEPSTGAPGSISLNINGGTLPYLFAWSSAETTQNLSISQPGTYTVTVSDANGCTISSLASVDIVGFPWGLIQNQQHHKIVIPPTASIVFDGNTPAGYDAFGVFYSVNGLETCGGYLIYNSNTDTLLAYGNNPSTSAIDGFQPNEDFVWKIWDASSDSIYEVAAYYNAAYPQTGQFAENGLSRIDSMQYNSLSGYVSSYSKSPLQSGKLLLIRAENDRYQTILVKDIEDGYFRIAGIYPGDYLIYAIPNPKDEIGIPTYFINHLGWETANLISVAGHTGGINLTLKPSLPLVSGAGLIQGIVHNDSSELYNPVLFETDWFPDAKLAGNVARNVPVLLFNDQHEPAVFTLSDANGMFRFPDLDYGTYYVGAELAGLSSDSVEVVLDATRPTANVNFTIQDESVIGIPVPELITDLAVYPNPASHELFIQAQSPISQIRLNSLDGKSSEFEITEQQADFLRLDISMLPAGIYVLELSTPSGTQYCKVLKME
ncbi:MAG: T9SS type A sorting domain-containing protein [Bacteroidales bacterium]|nr:T9SS type A sorting domain-containing protein [Bacteroidales bacterium]